MEVFEPPKYITSLIAAVNDGAKSAQLGALAFTAIGLFHTAETFVGAHYGGSVGVCGRQVGADHIDAVERGLGGD
jgi:hypothetical protein